MPRRKPPQDDAPLARALRLLTGEQAAPVDLAAEYATLVAAYRKLLRKFHKTLIISDTYEAQHQEMVKTLEETTRRYRQLTDVALPICMYCKKIRTDEDYWQKLETFFSRNAGLMFSHGICPECIRSAYAKMGLNLAAPAPDEGEGARRSRERREAPEDDALREMRALLRQRAADGEPLPAEVELFAERYGKLSRRFHKIVTISDSYQSQLMELKARMELVARTDLLTGLANRWETMARLEAEKSRSERYGTLFSVLIADIDFFKRINDSHGHQAGDRVLRLLAETLRANLRNEDVCGRWGGEEFLLVLPETDRSHAALVAEKLLARVRAMGVQWEGCPIPVTMSVGYGACAPGTPLDDFLLRVDDALYAAKAGGRDRAAPVGG